MSDCVSNLSSCDAMCCKELSFVVRMNPLKKDYYIKHGCKLKRLTQENWLVIVPMVCPQLEDNRCKLHATSDKPIICSRFDDKHKDGAIVPKHCIYG